VASLLLTTLYNLGKGHRGARQRQSEPLWPQSIVSDSKKTREGPDHTRPVPTDTVRKGGLERWLSMVRPSARCRPWERKHQRLEISTPTSPRPKNIGLHRI